MTHWPIPGETEQQQRLASDPQLSAWVRANAGAGKTHVLAHRVVRLLLAGTDPSKILCLTFTKAAAANMSERVFSILSGWTAMSDVKLRAAISAMGGDADANLVAARRLFARAVETPGGLKIQTIHAFCERILHLFPFEANVAAGFEALDGEQRARLLEESRSRVLAEAMGGPDSPLGLALKQVAAEASDASFEALLDEALKLGNAIGVAGGLQSDGFRRALHKRLGIGASESVEALQEQLLREGIAAPARADIISALEKSSANDKKLAQRFHAAFAEADVERASEAYINVFMTKGDEGWQARKKLVTDSFDRRMADLLDTEKQRVVEICGKLIAARAARRSLALVRIADAALQNYARMKQARGLLDFDDMIQRTRSLLQRSDAAWVLYKLDGGIDHVLVDEAQDTSPEQWEILKSLVSDFFSGAGGRSVARTFFAVGDEKQSIFSFQGAAPRAFGEHALHFAEWITQAKMQFKDIKLRTSFRSVETVLKSVDQVFSAPERYRGLSHDDDIQTLHEAWKKDLPGLVEIWPLIAPQQEPDARDWRMPVDALPATAPASVLAARIAQRIRQMLAPGSGEAVHDKDGAPRAVSAGDIMILVRRRGEFFDAVIRALKYAGVAVAGADRLKLMDHIAVMDLAAAGRAALLPQDDLTLACVLKSPLFEFDDQDLMRLAPGRDGALWDCLQSSSVEKDREAARRIAKWSESARSLGPFRFYARILGAEAGRRAMLSRLGGEAGDAMDEFLRLALQWERDENASLSAFLQRMQGADIEIKRDMEAAGEAVRVMTVHAAKGLEAKIVFLPDTCAAASGGHDPRIVEIDVDGGASVPLWRLGKKDDPPEVRELIARHRAEEEDEYRRLLYVAMTRAEERLYIAGYTGKKAMPKGCWYELMSEALTPQADCAPASWGEGEILRIGGGASPGEATPLAPAASAIAPDWLQRPAERELPPAPPVRPSQTIAAADQMDANTGNGLAPGALALLEGTLCHALLQYLPGIATPARAQAAANFLSRRGRALPPERREALARDVLALLGDAKLAHLFAPGSRAEAAIAGRIAKPPGGFIEISGRIDRLSAGDAEVFIADFKTGRPKPATATPQSYINQMALYRAALTPLFPGKPIRALIVWTGGLLAVEIASADMDSALAAMTGA